MNFKNISLFVTLFMMSLATPIIVAQENNNVDVMDAIKDFQEEVKAKTSDFQVELNDYIEENQENLNKKLSDLTDSERKKLNDMVEKKDYWQFMNSGLKYMIDYAERRGYHTTYPSKAAAMQAGLNVGLFYKNENDCSDDLCRKIRERVEQELTKLIKEHTEININAEKRISHDHIKNELERATEKKAAADTESEKLYWSMKRHALDKMNIYAVHQVDRMDDDVDKLRSGLHSALFVDFGCSNDECKEIRKRVNDELNAMIDTEQERAGITDEERKRIRQEKEEEEEEEEAAYLKKIKEASAAKKAMQNAEEQEKENQNIEEQE
jgi:hypothetical protein